LIALDSPSQGGNGEGTLLWSGSTLPAGGTYALYVDDDEHLGPGEPSSNQPETGEAMHTVLTATPSATVSGLTPGRTYYWHVDALDSGGNIVGGSAIQSFVVCVGSCIEPPAFSSTPADYGECGTAYQYTPQVTGTAPFQFSVGVAAGEATPSGLSVLPTTGAVQWTPTSQDEGAHHLELTALGAGGSTTQTFEVVVTCPNATQSKVGCACGTVDSMLPELAVALLLASVARNRIRTSNCGGA
jgi:hypothetical protein